MRTLLEKINRISDSIWGVKEREKPKMILLLFWMSGVMLIHMSENGSQDQVSVRDDRDKLSLRGSMKWSRSRCSENRNIELGVRTEMSIRLWPWLKW